MKKLFVLLTIAMMTMDFTWAAKQSMQLNPVSNSYSNSTNASSAKMQKASDGYQLVWSDEFNGNALDESRWNVEVRGDGGGNNELQYYTRDGVSVSNGNLVLTATRRNYGDKSFTSGRLTTQDKVYFKFGKIEARIKLPKTYKGLWPAFWTMGNDISAVNWPACGELDILEMGEKYGFDSPSHAESYMNGACHWYDNGHQQYDSYSDGNMRGSYYKSVQDGNYHDFTLEWTPERIICYIDGDSSRPYYAFDNNHNAAVESTFFSKQFFLLFNLAVGGDFPGIYDPAGITAIGPNQGDSQSMYVDYVRVYQRSDNGSILTDKGNGSSIVTPPAQGFSVSTAAPVPTAAAGNVKSLYSDSYQGVLGGDYGYLEAWGQTTSLEKKSINGNNYLAYSNTNHIGWAFSSQNYTDMAALHLDIYPEASGSIQIVPIHKTGVTDDDIYAKTVNVTAGKWNSIDIPLSDFKGQDFSDISQLKIFSPVGFSAFALDNVYFYKGAAQPEPQPSMVAAPVPTVKAERVISLYSDSYQFAPASLSSYNEGWGQSTKLSNEQISGNNYLSYTDFNYIGWQFAEVDASEMEYVHIDVYPKSDGMINIVPIYGGEGKTTDDTHKVRLDLTAGKWNSFNIPVSKFGGLDFSSIFQMKFDGDNPVKEFAIDNVYFYRTYDPVVTEVFEDGTAYNGTAHTASELNYKRAAAETGVWTPWYVPFETSVNELKDNGLDAAFVSGVHQYDDDQNGTLDRTVVEVIYLRNGNLLANYPYLVMAKSSSRDIDMTLYNVDMKAANDGETVNLATALVDYTISGTHQGISQSECNAQGYLVPGMMDSKTAGFVAPTNGVKPQSWVLSLKTKKFPYQIEQSLAKRIFIEVIGEEDIVTGIRTIYPKEEQTVEGIYDLSGRRLSSPVKGLNIINGKKVVR